MSKGGVETGRRAITYSDWSAGQPADARTRIKFTDVQEAVVALLLTCRLQSAIGQRVIPPPAYGSWPRARRLANELTDEAEAKQFIGIAEDGIESRRARSPHAARTSIMFGLRAQCDRGRTTT
jgi:hypothetical protein